MNEIRKQEAAAWEEFKAVVLAAVRRDGGVRYGPPSQVRKPTEAERLAGDEWRRLYRIRRAT